MCLSVTVQGTTHTHTQKMKYLNPVLRECSRGDSPLIQSDDSGNSVIKLQETNGAVLPGKWEMFSKDRNWVESWERNRSSIKRRPPRHSNRAKFAGHKDRNAHGASKPAGSPEWRSWLLGLRARKMSGDRGRSDRKPMGGWALKKCIYVLFPPQH